MLRGVVPFACCVDEAVGTHLETAGFAPLDVRDRFKRLYCRVQPPACRGSLAGVVGPLGRLVRAVPFLLPRFNSFLGDYRVIEPAVRTLDKAAQCTCFVRIVKLSACIRGNMISGGGWNDRRLIAIADRLRNGRGFTAIGTYSPRSAPVFRWRCRLPGKPSRRGSSAEGATSLKRGQFGLRPTKRSTAAQRTG